MSFHPSDLHANCSFECIECGVKVLLECACKACYVACDYAEDIVKKMPDDELCGECRKERAAYPDDETKSSDLSQKD